VERPLAAVTYLPSAVDRRSAAVARQTGPQARAESDDETVVASTEVIEARLIRALVRRSLSERELRSQAVEYGLSPTEASGVVDRLRELGYADDRRLAEQLRHSLYERKRQSRAVVARAMESRGIDDDIVREVLDDVADEDELEQALDLASKRLSALGRLDDETVRRRLGGFLARRGYPGHIVRAAVDTAMRRERSTVRFS